MITEEIVDIGNDEMIEIHDDVDTNYRHQPPALSSNMSTSGTGTSRTEHARGLHLLQVIPTKDVDSEAELEDSAQSSSNALLFHGIKDAHKIFNEINGARMQDPKNEVMVTRDS